MYLTFEQQQKILEIFRHLEGAANGLEELINPAGYSRGRLKVVKSADAGSEPKESRRSAVHEALCGLEEAAKGLGGVLRSRRRDESASEAPRGKRSAPRAEAR